MPLDDSPHTRSGSCSTPVRATASQRAKGRTSRWSERRRASRSALDLEFDREVDHLPATDRHLARCDRLEARELAEGDAVATGRRDGHTVCGRFAARTAAATLPVDAYERNTIHLIVPQN